MIVDSELISPNLIISDCLVRLDDEATRKGVTRGFYMNLLQQAMEEMSLQSYYNEVTIQVPMPSNGRWQVPQDMFNLELLYAFNGECCSVTNCANIYFKRHFNNTPTGQGYTAMNMGSNQSTPDPYFFLYNQSGGWGNVNNWLFANIQNNILMLSPSCLVYDGLQVTYNSLGVNIGAAPVVPRPIRKAITDKVCYEAASVFMGKYPKSQYGALYKVYEERLFNRLNGSWDKAIDFCKASHGWMEKCTRLYSLNYGNW